MENFKSSNDILDNDEKIRQRIIDDGYLYLQNFFPKKKIIEIRNRMLSIINEAGWIDTSNGKNFKEAIAKIDAFVPDTHPQYDFVVKKQLSEHIIRDLQHHERIISLFETIFNGPVFPLPRVIPRTLFPNQNEHTTPPHQDYPHVQGSFETYAVWIPLCYCSKKIGGISIASGTNKEGILPILPSMGAGGMAVKDKYKTQWRHNSMNYGDILIFNCMTVHKGIANTSKRLRISIDMRYQPLEHSICEDWLNPHRDLLSWDEIYKNWPDNYTKYYWKDLSLKTTRFNESYYRKRDLKAFEMAESGDKDAIATLERIKRKAIQQKKYILVEKAEVALEKLK